METEKFISVIIPTYNRDFFLPKAIDSVLNQTHRNFELIVVDDGSTDSTAELVAGYQQVDGRKIIYLRQENAGPAAARNRGIRAASYDLLAFLDSDDRFDRRKLELQMAAMLADRQCLISHTREIWYRRGRFLNQKRKHRKYSGYIFEHCLPLCAVGMSTVMVKRELFDMVGCFDEDFRCCEDYDFWLRVSMHHPFLLVDQPLTIKEGGRPDQVSVQFATGMDRYRIRALEKLCAGGELTLEQRSQVMHELTRKCRIYGNGCIKHGRLEEGKYYLELPNRYIADPSGS